MPWLAKAYNLLLFRLIGVSLFGCKPVGLQPPPPPPPPPREREILQAFASRGQSLVPTMAIMSNLM